MELGVGGGGEGERILHFSTIFDDLMDDIHCSAYFYHITLYSHEHKIHHLREIKSRELELGSRCWMDCFAAELFLNSCFSVTVFVTVPHS